MDGHPIRGLITMLVLVIISAATEAMVTALMNISETGAAKRAEDGERRAGRVVYLLKHKRRYITVTDFVRILVLAGLAAIYFNDVYPAAEKWFAAKFPDQGTIVVLMLVLVTVAAVLIVELFGIKVPKKIVARHAEGYAYNGAGLLRRIMAVFAVPAWLVEMAAAGILHLFHIKASDADDVVTEEELISSVTEARENGVIEAEEAEMIHNIFAFDDKEANDVMTHRKNIVAIPADMTIADATDFMLEASYSRFPVYEDAVENIVGILYLKDVMACHGKKESEDVLQQPVSSIAKEPYLIPDTQSLDVLFHDMQTKKIHMAIAIDEYGQTAGLVTMEDILEEIVGDIQDEYDEEEEDIVAEGSGSFLVRGMTSLEDVEEQTGLPAKEEEFDTLNGLLVDMLERIPLEEDKGSRLNYKGFEIELLEIKNKMVVLARITPPKEEEEEADK